MRLAPHALNPVAPASSHIPIPLWELVVRGWSPSHPSAAGRGGPSAPAPPRRELGSPRRELEDPRRELENPRRELENPRRELENPPREPMPQSAHLPLPSALAPEGPTLAAALEGDRSSWAAVLEPLHPRLVELAARRIPRGLESRLDPEDVVQQTYLHVLEHGARFEDRGGGSFLGWVVRLLENAAVDAVRHQRRQRRSPDREAGLRAALELADPLESGRTPLQLLLGAEERADLAHELHRLGSQERRLLEERFDRGLSFRCIARARGWSESTARRRLGEVLGRLELALA